MKKQISHITTFIICILTIQGCSFLDEDSTETENNAFYTNTLDQNLSGNQGHISEYF